MAKTNPIGVRFREEILNKLKIDHSIDTPQKALVFLERFYANHCDLAKDITQPLRNSGKTKLKDLTKPTNETKPHEQPQTNFSINTTPKTLDELKALCPAELKGMDRGFWIAEERKKHNL